MQRKFRKRSSVLAAFAIAALATAATIDAHWKDGLEQWRNQRAKHLSAPDGWLTLVGLEWLQPGKNSFGSAADNRIRLNAQVADHLGVLELKGNEVYLSSLAASLQLNGAPARAARIETDDPNPTVMKAGTLTLLVIHRGDRYALRIKDSQAPTRVNFRGLHWYEPDPRYRIEAKWTPFTPPHDESIPTMIGTTLKLPVPGIAEFTLDGKAFRLEPVIEEPGDKQLFFILRDTTSKTTTYGAARFLYTDFPDNGLDKPGHLILDFNRLQNPPCAYTPYATCPLPPPQNKLVVALPVGEQRYSH
ncbi:DUF1684 domain-containing protein [Alloacidobacterium dinghuense]|uniref:DUF1684 domain-containing protein n=1 Tax=Alloacidobacterium dinghuense TaxID=2763107 RepID=A0A7G8BG46_9BACT|nr:DUF1684 domain-containing protein [Alloacidobacterium dinghuense]QNI31516.1 DUF1684 domain-containing protein [Alloacidobacterium dinghuense]